MEKREREKKKKSESQCLQWPVQTPGPISPIVRMCKNGDANNISSMFSRPLTVITFVLILRAHLVFTGWALPAFAGYSIYTCQVPQPRPDDETN